MLLKKSSLCECVRPTVLLCFVFDVQRIYMTPQTQNSVYDAPLSFPVLMTVTSCQIESQPHVHTVTNQTFMHVHEKGCQNHLHLIGAFIPVSQRQPIEEKVWERLRPDIRPFNHTEKNISAKQLRDTFTQTYRHRTSTLGSRSITYSTILHHLETSQLFLILCLQTGFWTNDFNFSNWYLRSLQEMMHTFLNCW